MPRGSATPIGQVAGQSSTTRWAGVPEGKFVVTARFVTNLAGSKAMTPIRGRGARGVLLRWNWTAVRAVGDSGSLVASSTPNQRAVRPDVPTRFADPWLRQPTSPPLNSTWVSTTDRPVTTRLRRSARVWGEIRES